MKVTMDMIDRDLRFRARFFKLVNRNTSENGYKRTRKLTQKVIVGRKSKNLKCEDVTINNKNGEPSRLCVYSPLSGAKDVPGFLWIHGGGYAMGAPEMCIPYAEEFIKAASCVIVAPDYTLSIDKPYPAALEDCYDALVWMKENAQTLGIRDDQLFVGGESAGGGLVAALTLYARDKNEVSIAFQIPLYPMLDDRMNTASAKDNDAPVWDSKSNAVAWEIYLGDLYGTDDVPKYAAAARETDYYGLPPAYTFVGDIEPFHDETVAYIENLKQAGIPAEVTVYNGCYHGFDKFKSKIGRVALDKLVEEYVYAVENHFAAQK